VNRIEVDRARRRVIERQLVHQPRIYRQSGVPWPAQPAALTTHPPAHDSSDAETTKAERLDAVHDHLHGCCLRALCTSAVFVRLVLPEPPWRLRILPGGHAPVLVSVPKPFRPRFCRTTEFAPKGLGLTFRSMGCGRCGVPNLRGNGCDLAATQRYRRRRVYSL
jgi:hypothetical protein